MNVTSSSKLLAMSSAHAQYLHPFFFGASSLGAASSAAAGLGMIFGRTLLAEANTPA